MNVAIGDRHQQIVQTALAGEGPMAGGRERLEALLRASMIGHTRAVEAFLDGGVDVNAKGQNGWTPLLEAVFGGHKETILAILQRGANVNAADRIGWTPLMEAASKGRSELVGSLLAYGADVNARTLTGLTALQVTPARDARTLKLLRGALVGQSPTAR